MNDADLIDRAVLTAQLLTGNLSQAEDIALQAIESWDAAREPQEVLLKRILESAAKAESRVNLSHSPLPREMEAVLRLPFELRRCFVLRLLVGLAADECAQLLGITADLVDQYTSEAARCLTLNALKG